VGLVTTAPIQQSTPLSLTAATAFTPMVWGTTYFTATEFLPAGRPLLAATIRALPVGLVFIARSRKLPRGDWWWRALVLGALNIGAFFALLFVAAFRLPGGVAAITGAFQPLVAATIGAVVLRESFTRRTGFLCAVAVAGVTMLVLTPAARLDSVGLLAAMAGTVSMASGIVLTKRWGRPVDLITFTGWQLTAGGLILLPLLLVFEGLPAAITGRNVVGFLWLAVIGTGVAYSLWFRGVQRLPIATVSFLVLLSPLVATLLGWFALDQRLRPIQLVGALLVASAVVGAQRSPRPSNTDDVARSSGPADRHRGVAKDR
jgi:probable blue pigment (indigoidine) exporter